MSNKHSVIPVSQEFSGPAELQGFIARLQQLLRDGHLTQLPNTGTVYAAVDVLTLPNDGPWPDVIEAKFTDQWSRRFHLFVDTYHGSGGAWTQID